MTDNSIDLLIKYKSDSTTNDMTVRLPQTFENVTGVRLEMANIVNTIFNLNSLNNTLYMGILKLDAGTTNFYRFGVTIPPGYYTPAEVCTYLTTNIPIALAEAQPSFSAITVSVTFSDTEQKYTITETSSVYKNTLRTSFYWSFIVLDYQYVVGNQILSFYNLPATAIYPDNNFENSLNYTLGFYYPGISITLATASPYTYSWITDQTNRLNNESYIYLCSDLVLAKNFCFPLNTSARNVFSQIPIINFGSSSIFEPNDQKIYPVNQKNIDSFRVWFLDSNMKQLSGSFGHQYHNIKLRFFVDDSI